MKEYIKNQVHHKKDNTKRTHIDSYMKAIKESISNKKNKHIIGCKHRRHYRVIDESYKYFL